MQRDLRAADLERQTGLPWQGYMPEAESFSPMLAPPTRARIDIAVSGLGNSRELLNELI